MSTNYINHIAFVLDASGSMAQYRDAVIHVFDSQVKTLAKSSVDLDQETRVSIYTFSYAQRINNVVYDKDVMRLPSIAKSYQPDGGTALIDATIKAIDDLKKTATLYGDHAFLVYVLTDGVENDSRATAAALRDLLKGLPNNWTIAVLVPDATGVHHSKSVGFAPGNILQWDVSEKGLEEAGEKISKATSFYMAARATGVRSTSNLFTVDTTNLKSETVNKKLDHLSPTQFHLLDVTKTAEIRPFVESAGLTYVKGKSFYQLTKKEEVQGYKEICIQNKISGYVYHGQQARDLLGLPATTVKVAPAAIDKFNIYIQSTSVNRKLMPGTKLLVLK